MTVYDCTVTRVLLSLLVLGLALVPGLALADPWASDPPVQAWVATSSADVALRAGPALDTERLALVRSGTPLRVLANEGDWTQVFNPRDGGTAYVRNDLLVPIDAPSAFAYMASPPVDAELNTLAIATRDLPLYYYPNSDSRAQALTLEASDRATIVGSVTGDDGATWFQTDDGYYAPQDGLFLASDTQDFGGRWLDVSLSGAAHVVAYEEGAPVRAFYAIKGTNRFPTPLGVWSIVRRVADETMDSATVGIPRNSPFGYFLQHVLYTQYFRGTGESLHYNWWSSAWGTQGSHGCLGLSLGDSKWLWDWASIGTPVVIHP